MTTEDHTGIHSAYCVLTGRQMDMTTREHYGWNAFKAKGWTEEDLTLVVTFIKRRIKAHKRFPESFRFHNLILDHARFADDLIDARAERRQYVPPPTARERVLAFTGRPKPEPDTAVPVAAVLSRPEFADKLRAWREANL